MKNLRYIASITRKELTPFVNKGISQGNFHRDWSCVCGIGSFVLAKTLGKFEYFTEIVDGSFNNGRGNFAHSFVLIDKEVIVDITATQFGYGEVVVIPFEKSSYSIDEIGINVSYLGWPKEQNPYNYKSELNKIINRAVSRIKKNNPNMQRDPVSEYNKRKIEYDR
jgi:hypothetical protein